MSKEVEAENNEKQQAKANRISRRYYRKQVNFFRLINKMKLWPSRKGILHGVKNFKERGNYAEITTHCNQTFLVRNSRKSRAARWLRNKWHTGPCKACKVPQWKLEKYSTTMFNRHWGSQLREER